MQINPIIVVGSPRSGTSVIARLLQQKCGVMMDEGPIDKDERNPDGYYEDAQLVRINNIALKNWVQGNNHDQKIDIKWALSFAKWVAYRTQRHKLWGFKEPRMIGFINWVFPFFQSPIFIWPVRTDEQITKSQVEKFDYDPEIVNAGVKAYRNLIEKHLSNKTLYKIDLSTHQKEEKLVRILNGCLSSR